MKIHKSIIKKAFNKKIVPLTRCIGLDIASRTGWCRITTGFNSASHLKIDYGFIDVQTTDKYFKYNRYIEAFTNLIFVGDKVIIEESFYGRNVKGFQMLSRLGGFAYSLSHLKGIKEKSFILATTARKNLGFKGNVKKQEVHKQFKDRTGIDLKDEDVIDAFILALNGILETNTLQ